MSTTFVAHHGSPGTPSDFDEIKKAFGQYNWHSVDRYNNDHGPSQGEHIQVGYSWGSVDAIEAAVKNSDKTKGVILISPYLFVSKKMSPVIKTILSLPVLGNALLSKMAPKSIGKMIIDSSSPAQIPDTYKPCEEVFSRPEVLKPALFEKDIPTNEIIENIKKLKDLPIPVLVIRGDADKTSNEGEQFKKLAEHLNYGEVVLENGGHALPWTHTEGVINEFQKFIDSIK